MKTTFLSIDDNDIIYKLKIDKMKIVRNILLPTLLIATINVFAQEQNIDIITTTKVEKAKFLEKGDFVEKKIKITETRKQVVDTKPNQRYLLNQERLDTPIEVTKTILIDSDNDKKYDSKAIVTYSLKDDEVQNLSVTIDGNPLVNSKEEINLMGQKKDVYVLGDEDLAVFGYINENNTFVLEYF